MDRGTDRERERERVSEGERERERERVCGSAEEADVTRPCPSMGFYSGPDGFTPRACG